MFVACRKPCTLTSVAFFFFAVRRLDVLAARVAEREAKLYGELAYTGVDELWLKQQLQAKLPNFQYCIEVN
jgi:hypothetical protein